MSVKFGVFTVFLLAISACSSDDDSKADNVSADISSDTAGLHWTTIAAKGSDPGDDPFMGGCAIRSDGTLWCWGDNQAGQAGLGSDAPISQPTQVGTDTDWQTVSANLSNTCAIKIDGSLWCWGSNWSGQVGDDSTNDRFSPVQIGADSIWRAVALMNGTTCALKAPEGLSNAASTLWCWGTGAWGDDEGSIWDEGPLVPSQVGSDADWLKISAGGGYAMCGLHSDFRLECWGANYSGELAADESVEESTLPREIAAPNDTTWSDFAVGPVHSCALAISNSDAAQTLWCWGANYSGEVGPLAEDENVRTPTEVPAVEEEWQSVAAGGAHTCSIAADASAWCWGDNSMHQLGTGTTEDTSSDPVRADGSNSWATLSLGSLSSFGLKVTGTLWGWGSNDKDALGLNDGSSGLLFPKRIGDSNDWETLALGDDALCGLRTGGSLWCWKAPDGPISSVLEQIAIPDDASDDATMWTAISAGTDHRCAILDDKTLWCWGTNEYGQLGLGDTDDRSAPEQVGTDADWDSVSTGHLLTCAIKDDDTLWCWGSQLLGRLGNGVDSIAAHDTPLQVETDSDWAYVSAGSATTCAVKTDGTLWGWGANSYSNLGQADGYSSNYSSPVEISAETNWASVNCGQWNTTCGILTDNSVVCLGNNESGQLGIGAADALDIHAAPAPLANNLQASSLGSGRDYSLAVSMDHELYYWGRGDYMPPSACASGSEECGAPVAAPLQLWGTDWQKIAASSSNVYCGLKLDGSLWCWGSSRYGIERIASAEPIEIVASRSECDCPAGQYAQTPCSLTTTTAVCVPCSTCPDGSYVAAECISGFDTTCHSCTVCGDN